MPVDAAAEPPTSRLGRPADTRAVDTKLPVLAFRRSGASFGAENMKDDLQVVHSAEPHVKSLVHHRQCGHDVWAGMKHIAQYNRTHDHHDMQERDSISSRMRGSAQKRIPRGGSTPGMH